MKINDRIITEHGGKKVLGTITGKHGSADYYAVRLANGELVYKYGDDMEPNENKMEGNKMNVYGSYFYGNKISCYGLEHGYVDYATFAKAFDAVSANDIMRVTADIGYWEPIGSGEEYFEDGAGNVYSYDEAQERIETLQERIEQLEELEEMTEVQQEEYDEAQEDIERLNDPYYRDVYQWYIIDGRGAELCQEAGEIVYYNDTLDLYLWGVTHYGTSWAYVLTDIKCNTGEA